MTDLTDAYKVDGVADGTKKRTIAALGLDGERLAIVPSTCIETSYTPNGGFIAAADQLAMEYLEGVAKDGE